MNNIQKQQKEDLDDHTSQILKKEDMESTQNDSEGIQQLSKKVEIQEEPKDLGFLQNLIQNNIVGNLCRRFDTGFVILLLVQNLNQGFWGMMILSTQNYFKTTFLMQPEAMQEYISVLSIAWSIKIVYGLVSDNLPIFGTRRKSYIIVMGLIQFIASFWVFTFNIQDPMNVTILIGISAMSMAFVNVCVDAIMVVQSRKDKVNGSNDLVAMMMMANGVSGMIGFFLGGCFTQYGHPKYSYMIFALMGLIVSFCGVNLSKECELDQDDSVNAQVINENQDQGQSGCSAFCTNIKSNLKSIGKALQQKEIMMIISFFLLNGCISPSFSQFSYFFYLKVCGVTQFEYAMLGVIGQCCCIIGAWLYRNRFKHYETRTILMFSTICGVISSFSTLTLANRWNKQIGISDLFLIIFSDVVFGCLNMAFYFLPVLTLFAKITPVGVEATVFAFVTGIYNLCNNVISPNIGALINHKFVGVTSTKLNGFAQLQWIGFFASFLGFLILPLIPLHHQIEEFKEERKLAEQENDLQDQNEEDNKPLIEQNQDSEQTIDIVEENGINNIKDKN